MCDDGCGGDIGELIKKEPQRYEILPYSKDEEYPISINAIRETKDGHKVKVVAIDYPKEGLYIGDLQVKIEETKQPEKTEDINNRTMEKLENLKKLEYKELDFNLIDSLVEALDDITFRKMRLSNNEAVTVIESSGLPFVFKDLTVELSLQKLIRFTLIEIFDLIEIIKDNKLRSGIRKGLGGTN